MTDVAEPLTDPAQVTLGADGFIDPRLTLALKEQLRQELEDIEDGLVESVVYEPHVLSRSRQNQQVQTANERRLEFLEQLRQGASVSLACERLGVQYRTYQSWRERHKSFAAKADEAKLLAETNETVDWDGTPASFHMKYFGRRLTWFQLLMINELEQMPMGNIVMGLWPPDHGKTSTFEDHATRKLAEDPSWRNLTVSESREIAAKILGAVMNRLDPMGPTPGLVDRFGPFKPDGRASGQPWSELRFRVWKARHMDQRDFSMAALGITSRAVLSSRSDHVHMDDIQSAQTLNRTEQIETRVRQDFFSRAGEHGRISLFGSRVGDDDVWERLEDDDELDHTIMKVIKLRAIQTDHETGDVTALWPERYDLDQLDRIRRKSGQESFDRNYMMAPGASTKGQRTFGKVAVEPSKRAEHSLLHRPERGAICYATLDPSIAGKNCVMLLEATADHKLIVRRIVERVDLYNNAQVIGSVENVVDWAEAGGAEVTDLVIEEMAFQKGLMQDEALVDLRAKHRFNIHGHKTGINKYDADIGIPSMVESFNRGEIILPWADDDYTRTMITQLTSQLYKWKPYVKGNKLRQDMVMCLWFGWILWRTRWKEPAQSRKNTSGFKKAGLPWAPTSSGLFVPTR